MSAHHPATEDDMSKHAPEQRAEIVLAYLRREEPTEALCRRHNISETTLGVTVR